MRTTQASARNERGVKRVPQLDVIAAALVKSGDTLLVGGFGVTGNPVHLLHALAEMDMGDHVGNNVGEAGLGGGCLLRSGRVGVEFNIELEGSG